MAVREKSLRGQVFDKIRSDILKGRYQQGDELVECTIGKELGVSRTPVREPYGSSNWRAGAPGSKQRCICQRDIRKGCD